MYLVKKSKKNKRRFVKRAFWIVILILLCAFFIGIFYLPIIVSAIEEEPFPQLESAIILLDKEGEKFYKEYNNYRIKIPIDKIPEDIINGFIAVEDKDFFEHFGLDFRGITRAALTNFKERRIVEGGSTITQQLAKNLFLSHERTLIRKVNEFMYTLYIERNLSKKEIMEKYVNKVYFGHGAYGIEAASRQYFDKNITELDLAEKALLVGLVRSPYNYSPYVDLDAAIRRKNVVTQRMLEKGFITREEARIARDKEINVKDNNRKTRLENEAHYFADEVINRLKKIMADKGKSIYEGGLVVHTTLDRELQEEGENIIANNLDVKRYIETDTDKIPQPQGALVAIEPNTGFVRTVVGGRDHEKSQLNRANLSSGKRPKGSALKPFVYAAALDKKGYHPAALITCKEKEFEIGNEANEVYKPTCFGGGYHNEDLTLRSALARSCNVSAVSVNKDISPQKSVEYAKKFGIESNLEPWLSFPLGSFGVSPIELTTSYIPFANNGVSIDSILIREVEDYQGETVYEQNPDVNVVLDERISYQITDILKDVISPTGTASKIYDRIDFEAAGKTGTSQGARDAVFVGYTPELVTSIYVGDDGNKKLDSTGGRLAAPLWMDFMEIAREKYIFSEFEKPTGINTKNICQKSGKIASFNCPEEKVFEEHFLPNNKPGEMCTEHLEFPGLRGIR